MISESIKSPLRGFVYDTRVIDDSIVKEIIGAAGVEGVLSRWSRGSIVVYMIDYRKVESLCRYEECRENGAQVYSCLQECVSRKIVSMAEAIASSILDAVSA